MSTSKRSSGRSGSSVAARTGKGRRRDPTARTSGGLRRPFAADVLARARAIVDGYRLTIERKPEVGFVGSSVEMPFVMADGATKEDCFVATEDALLTSVATLLEQGMTPPSSASEGKREQQINIRVSAHEKFLLEEAARKAGFRSVSDYIRTAALDEAK